MMTARLFELRRELALLALLAAGEQLALELPRVGRALLGLEFAVAPWAPGALGIAQVAGWLLFWLEFATPVPVATRTPVPWDVRDFIFGILPWLGWLVLRH